MPQLTFCVREYGKMLLERLLEILVSVWLSESSNDQIQLSERELLLRD